MLQHGDSTHHSKPQGPRRAFPLLGGVGAAAVALGLMAGSLPCTLAGLLCAAVGGAGMAYRAESSSRQNEAPTASGQPDVDVHPEADSATSQAGISRPTAEADANGTAASQSLERGAAAHAGSAQPDGTHTGQATSEIRRTGSAVDEGDGAAPSGSGPIPAAAPAASVSEADTSEDRADRAVAGTDDGPAAPEPQGAEETDSTALTRGAAHSDAGPRASHGDLADGGSEDDGLAQARQDEPDSSAYTELWQRLMGSSDPIAELKLIVGEIHQRELDADIGAEGAEPPAAVDSYLARRLDEAGLFDTSVELPAIRVVSPRRTRLFYLRAGGSMSYGARLRIIALEAALNAYVFVHRFFKDPDGATLTQVYQLVQGLTSSVCAQIPSITMELPREGEPLSDPDGEWMVREVLGQAIETVQTPYRLTATYRSNVACGDVAIQVDLTPASVFPGSAWVEGLGIVPTTSDMRRKEASRYGLRMGIMLAACAFHASQHVRHVWVQGVVDTPSKHECYYHARIDRSSFRWIEMDHIVDPIACLLCLGGTLRHENGILQPVEEGFSLDDERFCPPRRYEPVALSTRVLKPRYARALGTDRVSGLAINEAEGRAAVADDVVRRLNDSTEQNVRMIFDLASDVPDPTVQSAARRTAAKLIEGTLPEDDALAVRDEFVSGDALTQAVRRAQAQLEEQDFDAASRTLQDALAPIDEANTYTDTSSEVWRSFDSYVDRALYNRLHAGDRRPVRLVPHVYVEAHMSLAVALLAQGDAQGALEHARRGHAVAPDSSWTTLNLVTCLEANGDEDEALTQLDQLLTVAHDPQGIGIAYYQMAHLQWMRGNLLAARACYERIPQYMSASLPTLETEMAILMGENGGTAAAGPLSDDTSRRILSEHGIPVAPSERIAHYFYEGMAASFDAEVFPVAKSFVEQLGQLSGDDVVMNVIRSVEGEPDA